MKVTFPFRNPESMFQDLKNPLSTWEYRIASISVIAQLIVGCAVLLWNWKTFPPSVPLWYSKPWGTERLASPFFLFLPLVSAVVVYVVNRWLAIKRAGEHPMFARVLYLTSMLVSCLSLVIVIKIVSLVD